jgi:AraC family transcriptional regulator
MQPRIHIASEKKIIGVCLPMSIVNNRTGEVWKSFMSRRKEIKNNVNSDLISLAIYDATYFQNFNPNQEFIKWAGVEVSDFSTVPSGFGSLTIPTGEYAIFMHQGSSTDNSVFQYIFMEWLPKSAYKIDHRPHFEVLGEKYRNNDPGSEEEIWIPIAHKSR